MLRFRGVPQIVALAFALGACGSGATPAASTPATRVTDLQVGDCYDTGDTTGPTISLLPSDGANADPLVTRVPCAGPHAFEVFGLPFDAAAPGAAYPGDQAEFDRSDQACGASFLGYVGIDYQASRLHARIRTPSTTTWELGDRRFVCALFDPKRARLTGSQKGSFTIYDSTAFGFTVSIPSDWTAGSRPGDPTATLLSGSDATIVVGVDAVGSATKEQLLDADVGELRSNGVSELMTNSLKSGGLDWSVVRYALPSASGSRFGIDALAVNRGRSQLLIWTSARGSEDDDLARFLEILQSFRSAP